MAPKRRASIRLVVTAVAAGLLVFTSASAMTRSWREWLAGGIAPLFASASRGTAWLTDLLAGGSGRKIREFEAERARLLAEVARREELRQENEILRAALTLRQEGEEGVIPAMAISFFREGRDEFLLLNRGVADGVGVGDLVVDRHRAIGGTIVSVGTRLSRAMLLSSPSRSTDVFVAGTNLRAIARGNNSRELIIELVPQDAELAAGDLLVASPRSTGGRRGLVVGEIRAVKKSEHDVFKTVRAFHRFDPATHDVLILLAP